MPSSVRRRTGEGTANDGPAPALGSRRYVNKDQLDFLTKALLTVAGHLKS